MLGKLSATSHSELSALDFGCDRLTSQFHTHFLRKMTIDPSTAIDDISDMDGTSTIIFASSSGARQDEGLSL